MTHQAPQNVQSSRSIHTVTSHGVILPQDENPPNPDRNDSTVSQADDLSAETEYLPGEPGPRTQLLWLEKTLFSRTTSPQNRKTFITQSKHMIF